jgi:2-polyprenyl-3-methyl-5-hydroxy-6-metoxy-1,4-benzoquinol methylase
MLKAFEIRYLAAEPFLLPLYSQVRGKLVDLVGDCSRVTPEKAVLDVGGRKSHYTIGLNARITVTDLPRESSLQHTLNLGVEPWMVTQLRKRRSNIERFLYDDMTTSRLGAESYDGVVAVEVLEHIERDDLFVSEVARVLRPSGWFLLTTPNGEYVKNTNPDHKRHYKRCELGKLLAKHFVEVAIDYAVRDSRYRRWGLASWTLRRPFQTVRGMIGNAVNSFESRSRGCREQAVGTCHLLAVARKP